MSIDYDQIITALSASLPNLLAIYRFGSQGTEYSRPQSDVDIAILLNNNAKIDFDTRLDITTQIMDITHTKVDLIDLADVNVVFQNQILTTGERIFCTDIDAALAFELKVQMIYFDFEITRRNIMRDIKKRGNIYG